MISSHEAHRRHLTFFNFVEYSLMPVLVYEVAYPRRKDVRWAYVAEKAFLGAYLVALGIAVVTEHALSLIPETVERGPVSTIAAFVPPMSTIFLIIFIIVFEAVCNAFAELTRLGDREFYGDFWNSTTFAYFSRTWNKPVHEFLLRHVYLELQGQVPHPPELGEPVEAEDSAGEEAASDKHHGTVQHDALGFGLGLSATTARYVTFLVSMALHEIVAFGIFGPVFPWLGLFSLFQFPLMSLMRSPLFQGKRLGNLFFWTGLLLGIPMVAVMYTTDYCRNNAEFCDQWKRP